MADGAFALGGKKVYVAGHNGMVGSALVRRLASEDCDVVVASRAELDLTDQRAVFDWFAANRPDAVFLAAARVGGILANSSYPGDFLYDNLVIETNVIEAARRSGTAKLLFLGSSCIYPRMAPQPIREESLLSGPLESTNEWYALAKIAGLKLAQAYRIQHGSDFISAMPTNLYGPGDNFDLQSSHVLPALIRKFHEAKIAAAGEVVIWGSGTPLREFLHVDDCADACVFMMKSYSDEIHVNLGSGHEVTIADLARLVAAIVGFDGELAFDTSKPDGTPRKLVDTTRLNGLGWSPSIDLADGIASTYRYYLDRESAAAN